MLSQVDGAIAHYKIARHYETIDNNARAAALIEVGYTPAIAVAISTGALLRRRTTIALAVRIGLIVDDTVTAAKIAGLIR